MTDNGTPEDQLTEDGENESSVTPVELPPEHPAIAPLSFLLGRWKGAGKGDYPTIKPFNFFQEAVFTHIGKPYLIYTSRTWRLAEDGNGEPSRDENGQLIRLEPLAVETGFWRPQPAGKVEVLLTHPTGITEIYAGELRSLTTIELVTDAVARTATAKPYTAGKRLYGLVPSQTREGEKDLAYAFDMAAMGEPLTPHLWAVLSWDWVA
jgi:THAP4-like, heme-binding beta-barrel domain